VNVNTSLRYAPLDAAVYFGHQDVVTLLLDNSANVNTMDGNGSTPLHWARKKEYKEIEDLLRQRGGVELPGRASEWPYP
jgi:ankyrin repeat protein